jgi:predicted ABC-type transport system involved in lysophospholipase L1 biosynthesis ATPase subunit
LSLVLRQKRFSLITGFPFNPKIAEIKRKNTRIAFRCGFDRRCGTLLSLNKVQGKIIVFITYEPDIAAFSKRKIVLRDSRIIKDQINTNVRNAKQDLENLPKIDELATGIK